MLGIIIVNYKTIDETVDYIKQELCKVTTHNKIVVVDVACDDISHACTIADKCGGQVVETVDSVPDNDKWVYVLPHKENLGYAKGNNLGAAFCNKHFKMDYFLFSNNDIKFIDDDVVEKLIEKAKQLPDAGVIGPRVVGLDGKDQSPHMLPISIYRHIGWNLFYPYRLLNRNFREKRNLTTDNNLTSTYCYWVSGCFVVAKVSAFIDADRFDSKTFLYGEEIILSERLLRIGYKNYFLRDVEIIHLCGQVTNLHLNSTKNAELDYNSKMYYYSNYITKSKQLLLMFHLSHCLCQRLYKPLIRGIMSSVQAISSIRKNTKN